MIWSLIALEYLLVAVLAWRGSVLARRFRR
jgi:hypothetical protein